MANTMNIFYTSEGNVLQSVHNSLLMTVRMKMERSNILNFKNIQKRDYQISKRLNFKPRNIVMVDHRYLT